MHTPDASGLTIVDLMARPDLTEAAARLLVEGFRAQYPEAWPDMESALKETHECLEPERICRGALDADGRLLGWIGAMPQYDGHMWEMHPIVVDTGAQRRGIGRALVADLEVQVVARGGSSILLGSDDTSYVTNISGIDLYPDPLAHLRTLANRDPSNPHPFGFYLRMGFTVVGVFPDANGFGKPDIMLAKRLRSVGEA